MLKAALPGWAALGRRRDVVSQAVDKGIEELRASKASLLREAESLGKIVNMSPKTSKGS